MIPLSYCDPAGAAETTLHDGHQAALERFENYLAACRRSPHTRRLYLAALKRWFVAGGEPEHIDGQRLARWLAMRRAARSTATLNLDIKALKAYYGWRHAWSELEASQLAKLPRQRRSAPRTVRWLTDGQVGEVLAACPLGTFLGLRDYAMILTVYVTGVRASELIGMELGDLVGDGLLFVRGKGGHHRYLPLGETLSGILQGYLHARSGTRPGKRNAFWVKENGRALRNGRSAWEIISKRMWQALGLRSGLHRVSRGGKPWSGHYPHELRASFATALLHHGMDISAISQLMGHKNMATTAHYLGVDLAWLRATAAHHPRALRAGAGRQVGESGSDDMPDNSARNATRDSCLDDVTPTAAKRSR